LEKKLAIFLDNDDGFKVMLKAYMTLCVMWIKNKNHHKTYMSTATFFWIKRSTTSFCSASTANCKAVCLVMEFLELISTPACSNSSIAPILVVSQLRLLLLTCHCLYLFV
jgi:hypothetical protein